MTDQDRQLHEVAVAPAALDRLTRLLSTDRAEELNASTLAARHLLSGRVVWNVNSTASGGGVAEMLQTLLAYGRGAGIDTRWLVLDGDPGFFELTKRLHNRLHGFAGDGGALDAAERAHYDRLLAEHHADLLSRVRAGDIALLHDPQTAGLVEVLRAAGVHVVWRCHIGSEQVNRWTDEGWAFLRPYVESADALVFSRAAYAPSWVSTDRLHIIAPSIDPMSTKNRYLSTPVAGRILRKVGLAADEGPATTVFVRGRDGARHVVRPRTNLVVGGLAAPPSDARVVVQVSRWDHLKDMAGVMTSFIEFVAGSSPDAHLLLVGPAIEGVADDPEGLGVLEECTNSWQQLPAPVRRRVHLVRVPMDDLAENALIVNAIQRRATVILQKSLAEGFGLTVTEAMWKARPVVASAVGGIPDQITSGVHGLLVDPHDLEACGKAQQRILSDPKFARRLGTAAKQRVRLHFLGDRHLRQYVDCFAVILS